MKLRERHEAAILRIQQAVDRQRIFGVPIIQRDWGLKRVGRKWTPESYGCCPLGAVMIEEQPHRAGACASILVAEVLKVPLGWVRDFTDGFDERKFHAHLSNPERWMKYARQAFEAGRALHQE